MAKETKQVDLEQLIEQKSKLEQVPNELVDPFLGVAFKPRSRNHYEFNDGVPFAPPVNIPRPSVRQRVENLLNRGVDVMAHYVGTEGVDMEVPDDPEAPLTASEANYIDQIASEIAEQAPLPDDDLPRPPQPGAQQQTEAEGGGEDGGDTQSAPPPGPAPRAISPKPIK